MVTLSVPPASSGLEDEKARRQARLETLTAAFGDPFLVTRFAKTHSAAALKAQFVSLAAGDRTDTPVSVAGRIMALRNGGMFLDVLDDTDRVQVFHDLKNLSPERKAWLELLDLGDIVGVAGTVRRTPRGELTVDATEGQVLSKALEPPPSTFHGLKDTDTRFRRREQDLVANPRSRQTLRARFTMIATLRRTLESRDFLEVETPMLHTVAGGALARPFVTHHNALDMPLYLRVAPELHLKRLVIGGLAEKVFEINRCFRNEGLSPRHNPEFTSVEIYQAYADFRTMLDLTETLVYEAAMALHGTPRVTFDGDVLDFTPPWPRKSMTELIREHTGFDFAALPDADEARGAAASLGVHVDPSFDWGRTVEAVFAAKVEDRLIQPVHVVDLPKSLSPLAKAWPDRPEVAQRFETYINGWEIANAYSELNDPREQRARFEAQANERRGPDEPPHPVDESFLSALAFGMPPMAGLGIGIDRLAILLTDSTSIREVIAFPTLRPE